MRRAGLVVLFLAVLLIAAGSLLLRGSPGLLVDDRVGLLAPAQADRIGAYHVALRDAHDIDYRVLVLPGAPDVNAEAARAFEAERVGGLSGAGRGLLLLIAPDAGEVRLEVGRSLEPVFTDAFVAYVENRQMAPFFAAGRVADGILATTELIVERAAEGAEGQAFADAPGGAAEPSAGGGARAGAAIGTGYARPGTGGAGDSPEGLSPAEVVDAYIAAMEAGEGSAELRLYTPETREMMRGWVVTRAQMRAAVDAYQDCGQANVFEDGTRAVVRYPPADRACAPFVLSRGDEGWQLDLAFMSRVILFNHRNEWHFGAAVPDEIAFAFRDWRFDENGFPRR
jgi:uncharacterized protein